MAELKHCPFCGGEPSLSLGQIGIDIVIAYYIECIDCASSTDMKYDLAEAIKLWNKRVDP